MRVRLKFRLHLNHASRKRAGDLAETDPLQLWALTTRFASRTSPFLVATDPPCRFVIAAPMRYWGRRAATLEIEQSRDGIKRSRIMWLFAFGQLIAPPNTDDLSREWFRRSKS
jgi:hypothetical protein